MSKSPSLRRIQADIRELALDPSDQYSAAPLENDMFEWHFTIRGAKGTDFEGGIYHGRILLPAEYPYKPPHIVFLTPSGRFETNTKVCLSFSAYHPELWQPAWGIRLILEALISFLPTPGDGAIGALDYKPEERKRLAKESRNWCCPICGPIAKLLPSEADGVEKKTKTRNTSFSKQIAELRRLQQQTEGPKKQQQQQQQPNKDEAETKKSSAATTEVTSGKTETETATESKPTENTTIAEKESSIQESIPSLVDDENDDDAKKLHAVETNNTESSTTNETTADEDSSNEESSETPTSEDNAQTVEPGFGDSLSKLYDPLLNISIFLMVCICALLWKKGMDLSRELQELSAMPVVERFTSQAASSSS